MKRSGNGIVFQRRHLAADRDAGALGEYFGQATNAGTSGQQPFPDFLYATTQGTDDADARDYDARLTCWSTHGKPLHFL